MAGVFKCSRCEEVFESLNARHSHSRSAHRSTYRLQLNDGTTQIIELRDGRFHCPVATCSVSYRRSDGLGPHYRSKHTPQVTVGVENEVDVENDHPIINQVPIGITDLSSTPEIFSNAKLCIVRHNNLVLLVCLVCRTALRYIKAGGIIKHVSKHESTTGRSVFAIQVPVKDQLVVALQGVSLTPTTDAALLLYTRRPTAVLLSPVPGVLIHRGFSCSRCIFFCKLRTTMANHRRASHNHLRFEECASACQVQALFKGVGRKLYGVDHGNVYLADDAVAQSTRGAVAEAFQDHLRSLETEAVAPTKELSPWLRESRWHEVASQFMPQDVPFREVESELKAPGRADRGSPLSNVYDLTLAYLKRTTGILRSGQSDYRLRRKVMQTSRKEDVTRGLNALQEDSTVREYCGQMASLILCLLRSSEHDSLPSRCVIYTERPELKEALGRLMSQVSQPNETPPESSSDIDLTRIHQVMLLLWTPKIPQVLRASISADCMMTRFLILSSLKRDRLGSESTGYAFQPIGKITKVFAKLHYWARCTIYMEYTQNLWHPNPRELQLEEVEQLHKYLKDVALDTPFNCIRQYMRLAKTIHRGTHQRARLIQMDDTNTACAIDGDTITLNAFRDMISAIAAEATVTLNHDVLLGLDATWIDNLVSTPGSIHDANQTDEVNYSFLTDALNPEFQQHGLDLLNHMFSNPMLMAHFIMGREGESRNAIIWNKESLQKWMAASSKLQRMLNLLLHFCSGLPARGGEYPSLLIRNTARGDRAFIWLSDALMVYQSYHKSANAGKPINLTARFIPETQSHLFVKMLCLVRPVQSFVADILWGPQTAKIYLDCWFVAMEKKLEAADLSNSILDAFQEYCSVPFAIAKYRHVAAYFSENIRAFQTNVHDDLVDASGGHATATVGHHYARSTKDPRGMDKHVLRGFVLISRLWHRLVGVTRPGSPDVTSGAAAPYEFLQASGGFEYEVRRLPKRRRITVYESNIHGTVTAAGNSEETDVLLQVRPVTAAKARTALERLGHTEWRSVEQAAAVALCVDNVVDFVAVLPTGSGKSLVFMAPSTMGPNKSVIVVVPLAILMEGHVEECSQANISCAVYGQDRTIEVGRPPSIIFVAVEIAACSQEFFILAKQLSASGSLHSVIFDEVHLLLADYRPSMRMLIAGMAIKCQFIGLSASVAPKNQRDIEHMLSTDMAWIRCPTVRPNIRYHVDEVADNKMDDEIVHLLRDWKASSLAEDRALVFCLTCKEVEETATFLQERGLGCEFMHAQLERTVRKASLGSWTSGARKIMVATGVISCGYNYKWVRLVIHRGSFRSLEQFHQESGRAGRDGLQASSRVVTCRSYRRSASLIDSSIATSNEWIEKKEACRRFGLHGHVDGKVQVCHLIPAVVLCDWCDIATIAGSAGGTDMACELPGQAPISRVDRNSSRTIPVVSEPEPDVVVRVRSAAHVRSMESDKKCLRIIRQFAGDGSLCLLCRSPGSNGREELHDASGCRVLSSRCFKCLGPHQARSCSNGFPQKSHTCFKCHFRHEALVSDLRNHRGPFGEHCEDKTGERIRHFVWQGWRWAQFQTELFKEFPEIRGKTDEEFAAWVMEAGSGRIVNNFVLVAAAYLKIKFPEYA